MAPLGSMQVPILRTLTGLQMKAKHQRRSRISLQFVSKRLGVTMPRNAHCMERTQQPFNRPALSPAAVGQLFDLVCRNGQAQLIESVLERLESADLQMHFPQYIGLNELDTCL